VRENTGKQERKQASSFNAIDLIETCKFRFRTLEDAEHLAGFIAQLYQDPARVLPGVEALLVNAVEHGNLDIGYQQKSRLIAAGGWRAEIMRRQEDDDYRGKTVEVTLSRRQNGIYAVITDQGKGFEWRRYMTADPSRSSHSHGRGIAMACAKSFDKLTYNETGNQAVAFVSRQSPLSW
jgi:hypothetical protein